MPATGFGSLRPLADAVGWVDAQAGVLGPEMVSSASAVGRVLAAPVVGSTDRPDGDRAAVDGYAIRAADTEGADVYAPLYFRLGDPALGEALPRGSAVLLAAGLPMPAGADTILPLAGTAPNRRGELEVVAPVAPGGGVDRRGCELAAGTEVLRAGRQLRPEDLALLLGLGVAAVAVVRRPRVRLVVAGPKRGGSDALTPMLLALAARDGATAEAIPPPGAGEAAFAAAIAEAGGGADLVLVAGRSGIGPDDTAASAVAAVGGVLGLHGVALRPGGSTGLGRIGGALLVLLPGEPLACLTAYDLLASRAIRLLGGLSWTAAYRAKPVELARKIVSAIGFTDAVQVRLADGRAVPLGSAESGSLVGAVQAQGFVLVPEGSEGFPPGSTVQVHLRAADWERAKP